MEDKGIPDNWLELEPPDVVQPCCQVWAAAHQLRTDSESIGALVGYPKVDSEEPYIGSEDLPAVKFCLWSGAKKGKE